MGSRGANISGYAIPYLTSWSQRTDLEETIEATAGLIDEIATAIEDPLLAALAPVADAA